MREDLAVFVRHQFTFRLSNVLPQFVHPFIDFIVSEQVRHRCQEQKRFAHVKIYTPLGISSAQSVSLQYLRNLCHLCDYNTPSSAKL